MTGKSEFLIKKIQRILYRLNNADNSFIKKHGKGVTKKIINDLEKRLAELRKQNNER